MKKLLLVLALVATGVGGAIYTITHRDKPLGASIPTVIAVYQDSIASRISNSATSFTLVRGTDKQARALSGFYGFVLDEGTTSEEFLTANCVSTACTIVARGIDVQDGKTEVAGNKHEHRRGATVKITNFPQLAILSRILNGQESASSTFSFGDGTTGDNKTLFADNGTTNKPFLRYVESTGLWTFSDNGTDTTVLNTQTSGGLTADSAYGIDIQASKIRVNASSTGGMSFDSDGKLYFNGSVNVPLTVGYESIFNSTAVFNGNVTTTGHLQVANPTADADAVNKGSLESYVASVTSTLYTKLKIQIPNTTSSYGGWGVDTGEIQDDGWLKCRTAVGMNGTCGNMITKYEPLNGWARPFKISGLLTVTAGTGTSSQMLYGFGSSTFSLEPSNTISLNRNFLGFWMKGNGSSGTFTIHGATANTTGFTTSTSLGTFTLGDLIDVYATFSPSSTASFYVRVNGGAESSASITTNLPTLNAGNGFFPHMAFGRNWGTTTINQVTYWSPLTLEF